MYTALFHVLIAIYYVPFAPLGLWITGFWHFYTPSAPLGLLEAGAHLTDAPFKQVLKIVYIHIYTFFDCVLMIDNTIYYHYSHNRARPRSVRDFYRGRFSLPWSVSLCMPQSNRLWYRGMSVSYTCEILFAMTIISRFEPIPYGYNNIIETDV